MGLLGWLLNLHYKLANRNRDLDEVMKQVAQQKTHIDALEVRMQARESQASLHGEVMTRQDRLLGKIEDKLDRLYDLMSSK
jgi:(p)ppGpp synthase/HD superfamily hydrolase